MLPQPSLLSLLPFLPLTLSSPLQPQSILPRQTSSCPSIPSPYPKWDQLPVQKSLPDPFLPLASMLPSANSAADVVSGRAKGRITTKEEWYQCRRPEILAMLQEYQFGYYPDHSQEKVEATRSGNSIEVKVTVGGKSGKWKATLQLPTGGTAGTKAPVVIQIGGMQSANYLKAGIAVVEVPYSTVAGDNNQKKGAFWDVYAGRDVGTLLAWAWGFHRTLDALILTVPEIDPLRVAVTGCSRLGKAALAAGLFDTRITLTMPMSSGVQGLGPYRYHGLSGQDETLENSKSGAGWWTNSKLGTFVNHHESLPFDAHTIASAIAPRALIADQGTGDQFVDSKGTSIVMYPAAKAVYDWLGVGENLGLSVRGGGHCDMSGFTAVLPFVQKIFFGTATTKVFNTTGSYGAPMASAFPWTTASPPKL